MKQAFSPNVVFISQNKGRIAQEILEDLPKWFGIPASIAEYVKEAARLPMLASVSPDGTVAGFLSLKATSAFAMEVHVMGVRRDWQGKGVGRALVQEAKAYAEREGARFLTVKTIAASKPDENYAATRAFYESVGFLPVEEFPTLWGINNPCLLMILPIGLQSGSRIRSKR